MNSKLFRPLIILSALLFLLSLVSGCTTRQESQTPSGSGTGVKADSSKVSQPQQKQQSKKSLTISTASTGGLWYSLGTAWAKIIQENVPGISGVSVVPGGSESNTQGVSTGQFDLALTLATFPPAAAAGKPPYDQKYDGVRHLFNLHPQVMQIPVMKDSGIKSVPDFKGKRISLGPKGQSNWNYFESILKAYGMTLSDLGAAEPLNFEDSITQMKNGRLNSVPMNAPIGWSFYLDLAQSKSIDIIPLEDKVIDQVIADFPGLQKVVIPAGVYPGVDYAVPSVGVATVLIFNKDLPEELVYNITKALVEKREEWQSVGVQVKDLPLEWIISEGAVLRHPGTERYLAEKGMK